MVNHDRDLSWLQYGLILLVITKIAKCEHIGAQNFASTKHIGRHSGGTDQRIFNHKTLVNIPVRVESLHRQS